MELEVLRKRCGEIFDLGQGGKPVITLILDFSVVCIPYNVL